MMSQCLQSCRSMPPKKSRTYGSKKSVTTTTSTKLFGKARLSSSPPQHHTRSVPLPEPETSEPECNSIPELESVLSVSQEAGGIEDLTQQLSHAHIDDTSLESDTSSEDGSTSSDITPVSPKYCVVQFSIRCR